jgi:hypothetical protein
VILLVSGGLARPAAAAPRPVQVDGVPLVPLTRVQQVVCQKLATKLRRPVPCPGLLPVPIPVSPTSAANASCLREQACGPADPQIDGRNLFLSQMNFVVPTGYVGVSLQTYTQSVPATATNGGPLGHVVFEAGAGLIGEYEPGTDRAAAPLPSYCTPLPAAPAVRIHGAAGRFFQCADSSADRQAVQTVMGHDLLEWTQDGLLCQVSFHGHSLVNLALDVAGAQATQTVAPRR